MFQYAKKLKDTQTFYDLKTKKLLKPRNSFTNQEDIMYWDYLTEKGEVPVNMLETGYQLKLPTGAEYPGDTKFNDVIRNTIIDKFFKTETLKDRKNVWKALTGRYFAVPMGVGVGITQFQRRNDQNTNNHTK